jgi:hypothetical protein
MSFLMNETVGNFLKGKLLSQMIRTQWSCLNVTQFEEIFVRKGIYMVIKLDTNMNNYLGLEKL